MIKGKRNKNFVLGLFILLVCLNILAWTGVFELSSSRDLEVVFFDIGQGDAIFIETLRGHQILIDGGPDINILEKLGREMPFFDRTIDLVILTHPEQDHIAGLIEVLERYRVEYILWTGVNRKTAEYERWREVIDKEEKEGAIIKIAKSGQKIFCSAPESKDCYFEILYPFECLEGKEVKNANNTSIVARLVFKNNSFLFTGDIPKSVEAELIKEGANLDSDVLKVAHHGSKTSTIEDFIWKVSPEIAVIQAGRDNRYGFPHQEVLEILQKFDIKILRTDKNGDVKIISDGSNLLYRP